VRLRAPAIFDIEEVDEIARELVRESITNSIRSAI